jgi:hypothetical protein
VADGFREDHSPMDRASEAIETFARCEPALR